MAEVMVQHTVSPSRKRNHEGDIVDHDGKAEISDPPAADNLLHAITRQSSPAPGSVVSELTELASSISSPGPRSSIVVSIDGTTDKPTPTKKPKLTFAEREVEKAVKRREKEEKEKSKAEEQARKEEERRQRDEGKRQKEEEKEAARRVRELEKAEKKKSEDAKRVEREEKKRAKDAEKQEKEAEKRKKERAQLRIGAFFGKPAPTSTPPSISDDISTGASSRRSSVTSIDLEEPVLLTKSITPANPEFEKYIIPYFVHEHTEVAPNNRFQAAMAKIFDGHCSEYVLEVEKSSIPPLAERFSKRQRRMPRTQTVKQMMEDIQKADGNANSSDMSSTLLRSVPLKLLSFREDIRPAYVGTYTTTIAPTSARRISRNPTYRGRPDTNYDYDSEAEWEPPAEDDDDINLEDEMSESEDGDEEMDDFLDDENDAGRRRLFVNEMEPVSTGLCWADDPNANNTLDLKEYRMAAIHDSTTFPIDPYSTKHWTDDMAPKAVLIKQEARAKTEVLNKTGSDDGSMPPPPSRIPLAIVNAPNGILSFATASSSHISERDENASPAAKQRGRPPNPNKELKMIQNEYLPAFKRAINGSDLTKAGLIEILKKQFPKCSKDAIKDTLGIVAVRVGKKEVEKKWELV